MKEFMMLSRRRKTKIFQIYHGYKFIAGFNFFDSGHNLIFKVGDFRWGLSKVNIAAGEKIIVIKAKFYISFPAMFTDYSLMLDDHL